MVSIAAFQAVVPGSIPGRRRYFYVKNVVFFRMYFSLVQYDYYDLTKYFLRRPGIEPGTTAWKAAMLTITPSTLL